MKAKKINRKDNKNIGDIILNVNTNVSILLATHIITIDNKKILTKQGRIDVSDDRELMQAAVLNMKQGTTFRPHVHLKTLKTTMGTQEAWVIIDGMVAASIYYENEKVYEQILRRGDCLISYRCGHTYEILRENTIVYEMKTGPYLGQAFDKKFIDE